LPVYRPRLDVQRNLRADAQGGDSRDGGDVGIIQEQHEGRCITMNISHVGKSFVAYYNEQNGTNYSVKKFFDNFVWKYLYDVSAPFLTSNNCILNVKGGTKHEDTGEKFHKMDRYAIDIPYRKQLLKQLHENVQRIEDKGVLTGLSTYPNFPTEKMHLATCGQRSFGIDYGINEDLVYGAFIGFALSISVDSVLVLFSDMKLNMLLFESWKKIKSKYDKAPNMLTGILNAVLGHILVDGFQKKLPNITPVASIVPGKTECLTIKSIGWIQFFDAISEYFHDLDSISVYAYKLGNQNSTYGICHFMFPEVREMDSLVQVLFAEHDVSYQNFTATIKPTMLRLFSFERAIIASPIGVRHFEPKGAIDEQEYARKGSRTKPPFSFSKDPEKFLYSEAFILTILSHTWRKLVMQQSIINTIKNTAQVIAKAIHLYKSGEGVKTNRTNTVNEVLANGYVKRFATELESKILCHVISSGKLSVEEMETIQHFFYMCSIGGDDKIFRDMSSMITLIRMEYSILNMKK
jgi:hypothetical protein